MDRDVQFDSSLGWKTKTTIDELKVISTSKTWFKPSMGERAVNRRARVEWRRRKWVLSENSKTLKQKCHQVMDQKNECYSNNILMYITDDTLLTLNCTNND